MKVTQLPAAETVRVRAPGEKTADKSKRRGKVQSPRRSLRQFATDIYAAEITKIADIMEKGGDG